MKTTILVLFLTFAGSVSLSAQDTTWFDSEWKECSADEAMYYHLESPKGKVVYYTDYFYPSHKVQNTGSRLNGKQHGHFIWYYENGQKSSEVEYVNDKRDGLYTSWYEDGTPNIRRTYKNGVETRKGQIYDKTSGKWGDMITFKDIGMEMGEIVDLTDGSEGSTDEEVGPYDFVILEKEPRVLNMDSIKTLIGYPAKANKKKIEGKVIVRVRVSEEGRVEKYLVIKDPHSILTEAVTSKIRFMRFSPGAAAEGKLVKAWATIPFDFKLH